MVSVDHHPIHDGVGVNAGLVDRPGHSMTRNAFMADLALSAMCV